MAPRITALLALLFALVAAPPAVAATTVKVRASDRHGRTVTFEPRGIDANAVDGAAMRSRTHSRPLPLSTVRRAVDNGRVQVKVSEAEVRRLRSIRSDDGHSGVRRWLRGQVLILTDRDSGGESPAAGEQDPSIQPPNGGIKTSGMLISSERLASLPTSGPAYEYMKQQADYAVANMNLSSSPDATSPWLPNYNGAGNVRRPGVQTLAAALVYARTGDDAYRDFVIEANRYLIGSEDSPSTDGTADNDRTLATARNIGAFVVAADLVGMDLGTTGSRAGYTDLSWQSWLAALRTKTIGAPANCNSLVACSNERAHNWASFATAARIAIDIHLNDQADLAAAVGRLRRFLGESSGGTDWKLSSDFDLSFACVPSGSEWMAINPASCGLEKDGMIVEDISRSAGSFPSYDSTGIGYTMESYQGLLFSATLLERQGYDVFSWGDQALKRVMDWLVREGIPQGNNSSVERHQSWVAQYFYGTDYPTVPAGMGRTLGFTDWLFA